MVRKSDKETCFLRITPKGLVPVSGYDAEIIGRHSMGKVVEATLHEPHSEDQHRLLRRIVGIVANNTDKYPNGDALMFALKVRLGHVHSMTLIGDGVMMQPRSLKEMDGPALNEFFDRCMDVIENEIIPGFDTRPLRKESRRAVGSRTVR